MKKVLVLMATYNGEKYLDEQLDSLFKQENVKVTVLVRDDGSSDKTVEILERRANKEALEWYTGGHLNVKYGFYDLMEHASKMDFDYAAFCDQDDVWDPDKLFCAVTQLEKVDSSVEGLYYCGQRLVDENLELITVHCLNEHRNLYARFMLNDAAGCTEVFNRTLLNKIVQYRPEYMLMHDAWLVKVCLAVGGDVIVDPQPHMAYRQHGGNVVGLRRDFKSKLKRAKQYINEQNVETQMKELKKGYGKEIIPEYRQIMDDVFNYKKNFKSRIRLMNPQKFHYADKGIYATYVLKIAINKL